LFHGRSVYSTSCLLLATQFIKEQLGAGQRLNRSAGLHLLYRRFLIVFNRLPGLKKWDA
jgi:hypothetical protein